MSTFAILTIKFVQNSISKFELCKIIKFIFPFSKRSLSYDICDQIHQRELVDSLKLRERQVEIEAINDRIKAEEQRLDGLDVNNLIRERDSLQQEMDKLTAEVFFAHSWY